MTLNFRLAVTASLISSLIHVYSCRAAKDSERTRTCFVTGLPKHEDENTVLEISDLLLDLFEAYSPVDVHIIPGKGQAYIKVNLTAFQHFKGFVHVVCVMGLDRLHQRP